MRFFGADIRSINKTHVMLMASQMKRKGDEGAR